MQAFQVNLIITDYCMPGMTGYDLLKTVKVVYFLPLLHAQIYSAMKFCIYVTSVGSHSYFLMVYLLDLIV
jgi:DNA-binding NarL/FixJ family response regulator